MKKTKFFIFFFLIILPLQNLKSEIIIMSACDDKQDEFLKNEYILNLDELIMIRNIANIFNLNDSQFDGIKESRKSSDKLNPYVVLGCNPSDDFVTIRKKYLKLSKEHHPDVLVSKGVPKEVIEESKKKMRAINSAYDKIEKMKK